jgi:hypothetical protein
MATMTLNLTEAEMAALEKLADDQQLSKTVVMRQALRLYQLVILRAAAGETFSFSGDRDRAIQFVGIGFPLSGDTGASQ